MMDGMNAETKGPFRVNALEDLKALVGEELAVTNYRQVTQEQVIRFAEATGDAQWIHVDVERARRESPYAGTIAHGFLTLSLLAPLMGEAVAFACPLKLAVNYGLDRVRFPAPVLVGSRIRARVVLSAAKDIQGGLEVTWNVAIECEGGDKPSCVAQWVVRYHP